MNTNQPHVLITGAAGGIGFELTKLFASHGRNLVLVDKDEAALNSASARLAEFSVGVRSITKDLSRPEAAAEIAAELTAAGIEIDVLINNAGFGISGNYWETNVAGQTALFNVNMITPALLARFLLPAMVGRGRGGVINICSMAAFGASGATPTYYASKAFLMVFSEGVNISLKGTGVVSTAVCPGPTRGTRFNWFDPHAKTSQPASPFGLTAAQVAAAAYKGFAARKQVVVPGTRFLPLYWFSKLMPRKAALAILQRFQ